MKRFALALVLWATGLGFAWYLTGIAEQQVIVTAPGSSDLPVTAFNKVNANFTELYGLLAGTNAPSGKQPLDSDLTALSSQTGTGFYTLTGVGSGTTRTINGTSGEVTVTNGNGVSGNPVISLADILDLSSHTSLTLPNSSAPATAAFGQLAGKNNAWATSRGALQFFDGTANTYLIGALASDMPSNGQVPRWNTGGTVTWDTIATPFGWSSLILGQTVVRTNYTVSNLPSGTNDVFTVPTGYRAFLIGSMGTTNALTNTPMVKISGTYYQALNRSSLVTNNMASLSTSLPILNAGETFALNVNAAGMNGTFLVSFIPDSSAVRAVWLFGVDNTIKTLYTCPINTFTYNGALAGSVFGYQTSLQTIIVNNSGGTRTYSVYRVPSGGSPDSSNILFTQTTSDGAANVTGLPVALNAGDSIRIVSDNSDSSQFAFLNVLELSSP